MTAEELFKKSSQEVRNTPDLFAAYVRLFKERFGREPICAGCTFQNDFFRLKNAIFNQEKKIEFMEPTFQIKKREGKILAYHEAGRTYRSYDTRLTENFVIKYLTLGTPEELEERRKQFTKLPESLTEKQKAKTNAKRKKK